MPFSLNAGAEAVIRWRVFRDDPLLRAYYNAMIRHVGMNGRICTDPHMIADSDCTDKGGSGPDIAMIADHRRSLPTISQRIISYRYILKNDRILPDFRFTADENTVHTVRKAGLSGKACMGLTYEPVIYCNTRYTARLSGFRWLRKIQFSDVSIITPPLLFISEWLSS